MPSANENYQLIEKAIAYINDHFQEQPGLDVVADSVGMSPYHFQRLFQHWAGVSPKKFLQFISLCHARELLSQQATMAEAAFETGFSGTGRLHDLFVSVEGMTPGEFKNGGEALHITYSFHESLFGDLIVASTPRGVCHLQFFSTPTEGLDDLVCRYPKATYTHHSLDIHHQALSVFKGDTVEVESLQLHLAGTPFQLKVWECLLQIPSGALVSYGNVANKIGRPNATRAVGTAIGTNPVAVLIPCHRVIRQTGKLGGYRWGVPKKMAIIGWEQAKA